MSSAITVYTPHRRSGSTTSVDASQDFELATQVASSIDSTSTIGRLPDRRVTIDHLPGDSTSPRHLHAKSIVCVGLTSALFKPLVTAIFNPKKLTREMILACDLERLCVALLHAVKCEERPFPLVGFQMAGMCVIASQKLKLLSVDVQSFCRRLAILAKPPPRTPARGSYFEGDDDNSDVEYRRVSRRKRSTKKKNRIQKRGIAISNDQLRLEKFAVDTDFHLPIERVEMMQMMNLGIGLGMSTELAFYSESDAIKTSGNTSLQNVTSTPPLWTSIENLRMLTSPFRLNAYSFGGDDMATTVATSDFTIESDNVTSFTPDLNRYDMDWNLYNDPINGEYQYDVLHADSIAPKTDPFKPSDAKTKEGGTLVLYDKKSGSSLHLKRVNRQYDRKLTHAVKARPTTKRQRVDSLQQNLMTMWASPSPARALEATSCQKTRFFNQALQSLFSRFNGSNATLNVDDQQPGVPAEQDATADPMPPFPAESITINTGVPPAAYEATPAAWRQAASESPNIDKLSSIGSRLEVGSKITNASVLQGYRSLVKNTVAGDPCRIAFSCVSQGHTVESVAMIFYRTLILANSRIVSLTQASGYDEIFVEPCQRFWEPIDQRYTESVHRN